MIKKFSYDINEEMIVKDETIKGFLIDFGTVQSNGTDLAPIQDLNRVSIDLLLHRSGQKEVYLFKGYLDDLLTALYAQTPNYLINKTAFGLTHKIKIDFLGGILALNDGDTFTIKMRAQKTAFTSLSEPGGSYINVETIPAVGVQTPLPVVKSTAIANGSQNVDLSLGSNIHKIVAALDYTSEYVSSGKAKFDGIDIVADNYSKNVSKEILEVENINYLDFNPDTPINQLVLFWEPDAIHNVRMKGKLDQVADQYARILTVQMAYI